MPAPSDRPGNGTVPAGTGVPLGDSALRFKRSPGSDGRTLLDLLRSWPRVIDAVVTEGHACIYFDPASPPDDPTDAMSRLVETPRRERKLVVIHARYDGPDLDEVARLAGLSREQTIHLHTGR